MAVPPPRIELGIQESSESDPGSTAYKWLKKLLDQMGKRSLWTVWALNPSSGNTGGLLKDGWASVNPGKYTLIKPYLAGSDWADRAPIIRAARADRL